MHQPFFFTTCNFCHNSSNPFFFTTCLRQCWHQIERNFPRYRYNERENYCELFYMITHPHPHLKFIRLNLVISDEYYIYSYTVMFIRFWFYLFYQYNWSLAKFLNQILKSVSIYYKVHFD